MDLKQETSGAIKTDLLSRHALAHDASHFLLIPTEVAKVGSTTDMVALLKRAGTKGQHVTFRSGGTSLSGQASGDGILADIRRGFSALTIADDGLLIEVEPGVSLRRANARLFPLGRKLGPDPASEIACTIGGVVANNSSGMACGTAENAYRTLVSAEIVLPTGTVINTADADADQQLEREEPELHRRLSYLRDRVRGNQESVETVTRLFSLKNTMGYSLNAFLDFDTPIDILLRLMVGSEGTLGFIAQAVLATVPLKRHTLTGLLVFNSLEDATSALPAVIASGAAVAELLDETSLSVAREDLSLSSVLPKVPVAGEAALLVEYQAITEVELQEATVGVAKMVKRLKPLAPSAFTQDSKLKDSIWRVRKGLYASVAARRRPGELSLLEDIAVPSENLLATVIGLRDLFETHHYNGCVIFGHAKDGNIHFLLNQSFAEPEDIQRFENFTEHMVDLVLENGGTLKAEHGTGRMMAPYLRRQYGDELYEVMAEIKQAFDPEGLLNPGVIINQDPKAHVSNLKTVPTIEEEADKCVECGYCELVCPSKDLTLTPRQRIVVRRDITLARSTGDRALAKTLERAYRYSGEDTCAVDGMCAVACPVDINTGSLVRRLRSERESRVRGALWKFASRHWKTTISLISTALTIAKKLPHGVVQALSGIARAIFGRSDIPQWTPDLPGGGFPRVTRTNGKPDIIFMASCTGTMFGSTTGLGSERAFLAICERAGIEVGTLPNADQLCCGTPWSSKGLRDGLDSMRQQVVDSLGKDAIAPLTVVTDASSCTDGYAKLLADQPGLNIVDSVSFVATLLERLPVSEKLRQVVIHPTCSTERLGITKDLLGLANHIAKDVVVPEDWGCCGFAGDRGMLFPELTESATATMAAEIKLMRPDAYASSNRTCEIAMTRAVGHDYANILELVEQASRVSTRATLS